MLAAGAAAVIATDQADVGEAVRRHTGGAGADIVLDLVMGPGQQELVQAARPGGTLVVAGFLDPRPTPFPASATLTIFRYRSFEHTLDPVVVKRTAAFLNAGVRLGALLPVCRSGEAGSASGPFCWHRSPAVAPGLVGERGL